MVEQSVAPDTLSQLGIRYPKHLVIIRAEIFIATESSVKCAEPLLFPWKDFFLKDSVGEAGRRKETLAILFFD